MTAPQEDPNREKRKQLNIYMQFSGLAVQMGILIGGGAWLGMKLDQRYGFEKPWLTILGVFLGITISFYSLFKSIKSLNRD